MGISILDGPGEDVLCLLWISVFLYVVTHETHRRRQDQIIWSSSYHLTSDPAGFPCVQTEADFNRTRPEPVLRCRGWTERPCLPIVYLLKLEAAADHL